jgi:hypothetical protein
MTNPLYLHFGKYTGVHLSMIPIDYLKLIRNSKALKPQQREWIRKATK